MIAYDDWSDLITVNYLGGMGGDFFSFLLDSCLRDDPPSFEHDENFKYDFYEDDAFNLRLKSLHYFFVEASKQPDLSSKYSRDLFELHQRIYAGGDVEKTIQNLRNVVLEKFSDRFTRKRVCSTHFYNAQYLTPQLLFPKSTNILLSSESISYQMITKFLFMYKMSLPRTKVVDGKLVLSYTMADYKFENIESFVDFMLLQPIYNSDELFIDMHKLIVVGDSYDEVLSQNCGTNIRLDKNRIKHYRSQTEQIISKYNININKDYDESVLKTLITNAVIEILREKTDG